ncbi:hypothetical protein NIES1031_01995 [Chroogloeocystis siderophila 5.2 s.c.1]|uniref:Uncharacterized protein n=1 Tax=Chroogloeocystis siderophila 5.2 s.c.1 TaxID=247279 RepID=A0A1U7HYH6_9CHRO|nr:hypothetical protein NIES1031_01995 [Chroogloeocystis siderophila 5.2 s.c.1]
MCDSCRRANDLFFNLPIAYFIGYVFSLFHANLFLPFSIACHWIPKRCGFFVDAIWSYRCSQSVKTQFQKKDLLIGLISSTVYTVVILLLRQFNILENPFLS